MLANVVEWAVESMTKNTNQLCDLDSNGASAARRSKNSASAPSVPAAGTMQYVPGSSSNRRVTSRRQVYSFGTYSCRIL